ncbi:MAG: transcriptional repressor LexA, partial [Oscillospiraceae bacterium]|nr:transcriptional repressor LexA [Oscillospiraceae bacterium]
MAQEKLTEKQQLIYDFIKEWTKKKSYPPTVRDICAGVDLKSTSSVHAH